MIYRIVANSKRKGDIATLVAQRFDHFNIWEGATYKKGRKEYVLVVEIVSDDKTGDLDARILAKRIQDLGLAVQVYSIKSTVLTPIDTPKPAPAKVQVGADRADKDSTDPPTESAKVNPEASPEQADDSAGT